MTIDQLIHSRRRMNAIFDAAVILHNARLKAILEPTNGWDILFNAQQHLMNQIELKQEAAA